MSIPQISLFFETRQTMSEFHEWLKSGVGEKCFRQYQLSLNKDIDNLAEFEYDKDTRVIGVNN